MFVTLNLYGLIENALVPQETFTRYHLTSGGKPSFAEEALNYFQPYVCNFIGVNLPEPNQKTTRLLEGAKGRTRALKSATGRT